MDVSFLTNRECAVVVWFLVAVAWFINKPDLHPTFRDLMRALFQPILVNLIVWAAAWTSIVVLVLSSFDIWEVENLKITIIWFGGYAFIALMTSAENHFKPGYFSKLVKETINLTALVTFFADAYSFSLWVELVVFPIIVLIFGMIAVADTSPEFRDKKYDHTKLLLNILVILFFFALIYNSTHGALTKGDLFTFRNLRDLSIPILLTTSFLPFLYGFMLVMSYERLHGVLPDKKMRRYGIWKSLWAFRFRISMIDPWRTQLWKMAPIKSKQEVDESIHFTIKAHQALKLG